MTTQESARLATEAWEACRRHLNPDLALVALADDPAPFTKSGAARMRLRLRPKKKLPTKFWGGWTCYEINVGHMPTPGSGLNLGSVAFIQSPEPEPSGGGAYAQATAEILRKAAKVLGSAFSLGLPTKKGEVISFHRVYPISYKIFPPETAGEDLARLISSTLPLFQGLPNVVS